MGKITHNGFDIQAYMQPELIARGLAELQSISDEQFKNQIEDLLSEQQVKDELRLEKKRKIASEGGALPDGDEADIRQNVAEAQQDTASRIWDMMQKARQGFKPSEALKHQAEGLEDSEREMANLVAAGPSVDFSPFAALHDDWFGGNLSKTLKSGPTVDEHAELVGKLQDLVQKQRGELTESQTKEIAESLGIKVMDTIGRAQRGDARISDGRTKVIADAFNKNVLGIGASDKKDFNSISAVFKNLDSLRRQGDVASYALSASTFAKYVGSDSGALSEGDVGRAQVKTLSGLAAKIESFVDSNPGTPIPREMWEPYEKIAKNTLRNIVSSRLEQLRDEWNSLSKRPGYEKYFEPGAYGYERARDVLSRLSRAGGFNEQELAKQFRLSSVGPVVGEGDRMLAETPTPAPSTKAKSAPVKSGPIRNIRGRKIKIKGK